MHIIILRPDNLPSRHGFDGPSLIAHHHHSFEEMDPSSNDDVPRPKRKMPNNKRKFGTRIKGGDTKPSTSNANASTVPVASEQSSTAASALQQQEAINPYTKMRVRECRATLVDRDTRISQLLKELEASKEETKAKDIIIPRGRKQYVS